MNLEDFQYIGTNITGFRLIDEEAKDFHEIVADWRAGTLSGKPADMDQAHNAKVHSPHLVSIVKSFVCSI